MGTGTTTISLPYRKHWMLSLKVRVTPDTCFQNVMAKIDNPEADAILDREFRVLDKGFARLVDYLGGDDRIVQAARVSYGKGTKTPEEDKKLIHYLMKNAHTSPLEQVVLTFHIKIPIFIARQWVRHRTARLNEFSLRYSEAKDDFYVPSSWRRQDLKNKQGSLAHNPILDEGFNQALISHNEKSMALYKMLIDHGAAREMARMVLPVNLYTEMYWQMDLHNLFHFLKLRLDSHAQYEIQEYGKVLALMAKTVAPVAYGAFEEHVLFAKKLSRSELIQIEESNFND